MLLLDTGIIFMTLFLKFFFHYQNYTPRDCISLSHFKFDNIKFMSATIMCDAERMYENSNAVLIVLSETFYLTKILLHL